jgi:hypothetical protein
MEILALMEFYGTGCAIEIDNSLSVGASREGFKVRLS